MARGSPCVVDRMDPFVESLLQLDRDSVSSYRPTSPKNASFEKGEAKAQKERSRFLERYGWDHRCPLPAMDSIRKYRYMKGHFWLKKEHKDGEIKVQYCFRENELLRTSVFEAIITLCTPSMTWNKFLDRIVQFCLILLRLPFVRLGLRSGIGRGLLLLWPLFRWHRLALSV